MLSPKTIKSISFENLTWYNASSFKKKEMDFFLKETKFHPHDLEDCLPPMQRPKIIERPEYLFMILLFPLYNMEKEKIEITEIDFFINKKYLVVIHENKIPVLNEFFELCRANPVMQKKYFKNPAILFRKILNNLLLYCFPILVHIGNDIETAEKKIFADYEKGNIYKILKIKTSITAFRKAAMSYETIIKKLCVKTVKYFKSPLEPSLYFERLAVHSRDIRDLLENYQNIINALQETNESLLSFRINEIMKTLTIFSAVLFPLTFLAAIFGMNALNMPLINHPYGFWLIIGVMSLCFMGMYIFFKKKKWL